MITLPTITICDLSTRKLLIAEAVRRRNQHSGKASQDIMAGDAELTGLIGEEVFALYFGLKTDLSPRPYGDDKDFEWHGYSIDVKTRKLNPRFGSTELLVKASSRSKCDILVHVVVAPEKWQGVIYGWKFDNEVRQYPPKVWPVRTENHIVPAADLRSVESLTNITTKSEPGLETSPSRPEGCDGFR